MPLNWNLMYNKDMPGHFEGFVVSAIGAVIQDDDARESLQSFEQSGQKGRYDRVKTAFLHKVNNKKAQKAGVGGATLAGAAAGAGLGMFFGPIGAFLGGFLGGAVAAFAQVPVNQVIANQFAADYDTYKDDAKNVGKHIEGYQEQIGKFQSALNAGNAHGAGHHLYKAMHHMAKVKVVYERLNASLTALGQSLPNDAALQQQLISGLTQVDKAS